MDKRSFLTSLPALGAGIASVLKNIDTINHDYLDFSPENLATDERYWSEIRKGYRVKPDCINLENGYYCITPQETLEHLVQHIRHVNYEGSKYMRTVQWENKDKVAQAVAELIGATNEEVIITRNTTESLDTIIGGFPWSEGDEAIMAHTDYGSMLRMFKQVEKRHNITCKYVDVPLHPKSDQEIVDVYASAITPNTKLLMVCHIVNVTGHILPVRKICDMAHARGVEVIVDGAHAYSHINFNIEDLDCDYYGASLHKWLSTPLGAGMLYVNKKHIDKIWPLIASHTEEPGNIRRLNQTGTHPVYTDLAILNALDYQERIGLDRKEARLRYLQRYWSDQVRDIDGIIVNTPGEAHRSCAIANVGIKDMTPQQMAITLLEEHKVWTVAIDNASVKGCRICPNIYTTLEELDHFADALKQMAG